MSESRISSDATPGGSQAHGWHRLLDWRPHSLLSRVLIVLLLVAPVTVAGTMMWAMWDPSKYMRDIDLAVVNEDVGVVKNGKDLHYGDQVVDGLLETDYLAFKDMPAAEAAEKLRRGELLMVVTIPKDFSEKAVTIISDNPQKPDINFEANDYYGTNGSVISSSLVPQVQTSIENAITKKYATQVIEGLTGLGEGLNTAADGATRLDEGAGKLQDGGARAVEGINKLDAGAGQLVDGADRLNAGANQLAGGLDQLSAGTDRLADGAGQIQGGVTQLTDLLLPVLRQVQQVMPDLSGLVAVLRQVGMNDQANRVEALAAQLDPSTQENMVAQLEKLRDGTGQLHYNLADPASEYRGGLNILVGGAHTLADGTGTLRAGATRLDDGAHQLADGSGQLDAGLGTLKNGTAELSTGGGQLADGLNTLKDGSNELATKLNEGAAKAPKITKPDESASNMAVPINYTETNLHPVQTVVSSTDPTKKEITGGVSMLFLMVFGFLIMLLVTMLLPYYLGRTSGKGARPVRGILGAWAAAVGVDMVVLLFMSFLSATLGWAPANWGAVMGVLLLCAMTAAATLQLPLVVFGRKAGAIVAVGAYCLGVMVFGGVWPRAALPGALSILNPLSPMTYAKLAFTRATDGIFDSSFTGAVAVLLLFTAVSLALSVAVFKARHHGTARIIDPHLFSMRRAAGAGGLA